jgi:hypothetical protein
MAVEIAEPKPTDNRGQMTIFRIDPSVRSFATRMPVVHLFTTNLDVRPKDNRSVSSPLVKKARRCRRVATPSRWSEGQDHVWHDRTPLLDTSGPSSSSSLRHESLGLLFHTRHSCCYSNQTTICRRNSPVSSYSTV